MGSIHPWMPIEPLLIINAMISSAEMLVRRDANQRIEKVIIYRKLKLASFIRFSNLLTKKKATIRSRVKTITNKSMTLSNDAENTPNFESPQKGMISPKFIMLDIMKMYFVLPEPKNTLFNTLSRQYSIPYTQTAAPPLSSLTLRAAGAD